MIFSISDIFIKLIRSTYVFGVSYEEAYQRSQPNPFLIDTIVNFLTEYSKFILKYLNLS